MQILYGLVICLCFKIWDSIYGVVRDNCLTCRHNVLNRYFRGVLEGLRRLME